MGFTIDFTLTGITPLLMHADSIDAAGRLSAWRQDSKNKNFSIPGDDRSPAWTWISYLYSDSKNIVMPSENIMVAIRKAGAQIKIPGKGQKSFKELTQSGMMITSEFCVFKCSGSQVSMSDIAEIEHKSFEEMQELVKALGFSLFAKRASIKSGTKKTKHIRVRPRFDDWSVEGRIQVKADEITTDTLVKIFSIAGDVGICDWRPGSPESPGPYGMFGTRFGKPVQTAKV